MATTLEQLPLRSIDSHPHNPRRDLGDLTELTASIKIHGVVEPIVVVPAGKRYLTIAGHRRLAAAAIAKTVTVPAIIREDLGQLADQIAVMLVENLHRADLTPVEESAAYQELLALEGYTVDSIAAMVGRSKRTVQLRLGLARLPEKTLAKVQDRQLSLAEAEVMATFAKDPAAIKRLEAAAGTGNFRWAVENEKASAARKRAEAKQRTAAAKAGLTAVKAPQGYPWSGKVRPLTGSYGIGVTAAAHETCPGHCAVLRGSADYELACSDAIANGHIKEPRSPAKDKPETAKQRATREAFEAGAAAAIAVRRAWLAEHLGGVRPAGKVADALASPLLLERELTDLSRNRDGSLDDAAEAFGLKVPELGEDDATHAYQRSRTVLASLIEQTATWPASRVVALLLYLAIEEATPSDEKYWRAPDTAEAYQLLAKAGYELSTWEQNALLQPAEAAAG